MDVEHLFDGQTLLFYFLGEMTPELEAITGELAELYETHVQFRRFSRSVDRRLRPRLRHRRGRRVQDVR